MGVRKSDKTAKRPSRICNPIMLLAGRCAWCVVDLICMARIAMRCMQRLVMRHRGCSCICPVSLALCLMWLMHGIYTVLRISKTLKGKGHAFGSCTGAARRFADLQKVLFSAPVVGFTVHFRYPFCWALLLVVTAIYPGAVLK